MMNRPKRINEVKPTVEKQKLEQPRLFQPIVDHSLKQQGFGIHGKRTITTFKNQPVEIKYNLGAVVLKVKRYKRGSQHLWCQLVRVSFGDFDGNLWQMKSAAVFDGMSSKLLHKSGYFDLKLIDSK